MCFLRLFSYFSVISLIFLIPIFDLLLRYIFSFPTHFLFAFVLTFDNLEFRTEPSRLQSLALQLSDKIGQLVENNERLLEQRGQVNNKLCGGSILVVLKNCLMQGIKNCVFKIWFCLYFVDLS